MAKKKQLHDPMECTQVQNIQSIDRRIGGIEKTLNGNGDNTPGMKTDIALIKQFTTSIDGELKQVKEKLSTQSEINFEIEVERRVSGELTKKLKEVKVTTIDKQDRRRNRIAFIKDIILALVIIVNIVLGYLIFT